MNSTLDQEIYPADMGHQCDYCKGKSFRRSRLQGKDWSRLLLLHYPVRCLSCSQRQSVGLKVALRSVSSRVKQVRVPRGGIGWTGDGLGEADKGAQQAAQPIGGGSFPALRARQSITMPDLHGVTLEHHTPVQTDGEHLPS